VSKSKPEGISRREFIDLVGVSIGAAALVGAGCGGGKSGGGSEAGAGGSPSGSGGASSGTGGTPDVTTGGTPGAATGGTPGAATGGTPGAATGGTPGAATGGTPGAATGGTPGAATGGTPGAATGGTPGAATGGTPGAATGGTPGAATGGTSTTGGGSKATGGASTVAGGSKATGGVAATGGASGTTATALVSLVRGTDWVQATQDAIAAAGGLPDLTGKTVMLRPNVISSKANSTTSPDVIRGVIKAVKAKGATNIIVAEDGWNTGGNTLGAMQTLGITAVCTAEGATPMDLSKQPYTNRTHASAASYTGGTVSYSDPIYNADYVIAIPVCKCHGQAGFTMALKLWYGNVPTAARLHPSAATFNAPAELHLIKKADFTVLDATKAMIDGGPDSGTMVQSKVVVASKDAIAADVTGLWILKYSGSSVIANQAGAWTTGQIKRALALKIPGWLVASGNFTYVAQGVTEATTIMGY
jgi:uncharacterized protein (DUF362 family)